MIVSLTIDGQPLQAESGQYLLDVAREHGIEIPTLCVHDAVEPWGGCRLCSVEIEKKSWDPGWRKLVVACLYPVEEGLRVFTRSEKVLETRRTILDLLLARAPSSPEIAALARDHGVVETSFDVVTDADNCINCGLCYRVCDAMGISAIGAASRGSERYVTTPFDQVSDACIGCLACAQVCPTNVIKWSDDGGTRTIWNKTFELLQPDDGSPAMITKDQAEWLQARSGLDESYFGPSEASKRDKVAQTLATVSSWDPQEVVK